MYEMRYIRRIMRRMKLLIKLGVDSRDKVMHNPTRMWANAQRDGRPAEQAYTWCPLFNAAKFG